MFVLENCSRWVTDTPFVISPRITFEVSVRLLGGLMALGYTIATILKRRSHVLCDDRVCIKIDWLEQSNRQYIQVQGKDRVIVKSVADLLGLEGSYTPRTYIEQIQLEKLVNEVMALPEDLKTKLSLDEDVSVSPRDMLSGASADRVAMRSKHQKSHGMSHSYSSRRDKSLSKLAGFAVGNSLYGDRTSDPRTMLENQDIVTQLSEQISSLNDRMDEFTSRIKELNSNLTVKKRPSSQQNVGLHADASKGPAHTHLIHGTRNGFVKGHVMPSSVSLSQLTKESPLMGEISAIT